MPHTCFVNGYTNRSDGAGPRISFVSIPAVISRQGEQTLDCSVTTDRVTYITVCAAVGRSRVKLGC